MALARASLKEKHMTAAWISNGDELPAVPLKPAPAAKVWHAGRFEVTRAPRQGRWSVSASNCGVAGYRTLLGALFAIRRTERASAHL